MAALIYLDESNLWIEGKKVSAVSKGMALDIREASDTRTFDSAFKLDFGRVLEIANQAPIKIARLYGSRPPETDSVWNMAKNADFRLEILDQNARNKRKGIDTSMVADIMQDMYEQAKERDLFTIVTGDADYVPVIERLKNKNFETLVIFWDHAANALKRAADQFLSLNAHLSTIRY